MNHTTRTKQKTQQLIAKNAQLVQINQDFGYENGGYYGHVESRDCNNLDIRIMKPPQYPNNVVCCTIDDVKLCADEKVVIDFIMNDEYTNTQLFDHHLNQIYDQLGYTPKFKTENGRFMVIYKHATIEMIDNVSEYIVKILEDKTQ